MLEDRKNFSEAEHIGAEIMSDPDLAMRSKCFSVHGVVTEGVFTLDKALRLYKVPYETYINFVAKKQAEEIEDQGKNDNKKEEMIFLLNIYEKLFEYSFVSLNKNRHLRLIKLLKEYSKDIQEEKLVLK